MKEGKIYLFTLFLLTSCLFATSCSKDDDNSSIDEEWKTLNETRFNEVATNTSEYNQLVSETNNGSVYWQNTDFISDNSDSRSLRITDTGKPEFTDTVVVRYEGWYINKLGEKVIFDSTENPSLTSNLSYQYGATLTPYPNKESVSFPVSGISSSNLTTIATCSGVLTLLQDMKIGDERKVCIPQQLGYGSSGKTYTPATGYTFTVIPAYTTLWVNIKLLKIIPMSGLSS